MSEVPTRTSSPEAPADPSASRPDDENQLWAGNWDQEPTNDEGPEDQAEVASPEPEPDMSRSILEGGLGTRREALERLKAESDAADRETAFAEQEKREADKKEQEKNSFEDALYGEPMAVPGPNASVEEKAKFFAPERMQRVAEADEYEQHLAMMAQPGYQSSTLSGKEGYLSSANDKVDLNSDSKEYNGPDADRLERMDKYAAAANDLRSAAHEAEQRGDTDKAKELMVEYERANKNFGRLQQLQERNAKQREESEHAALMARSAALSSVGDGPEVPEWMDEEGPYDPGSGVVGSDRAPEIDWGGAPPDENEEEAPEDDGTSGGTGSGTPPPALPRRTPGTSLGGDSGSAPAATPPVAIAPIVSGYTGYGYPAPSSPDRLGAPVNPDGHSVWDAWTRPVSPSAPESAPTPGSIVTTETGNRGNLDPLNLTPLHDNNPGGAPASPESGVGSAPPEAHTPPLDPDREVSRGDSFKELGLFRWAGNRLFGGERGRAPRLDSEPSEPGSSERIGSRGRAIVAMGTIGVMAFGLFAGIGNVSGGDGPQRAVPAATAEGPQHNGDRSANEAPRDNGGNDNDIVAERPVASVEQGYTVSQGEGFLSLLNKEGIPVERQAGAMKKILDLADRNPQVGQWVYQRRIGEPGIAKTGVMPPNVLELIKSVSR